MYIKLGTTSKPVNAKVSGGFLATTPIAKISTFSINNDRYSGTPTGSITIEPKPTINGPILSASLTYYKSYSDYCNGEANLQFEYNAAPLPSGSLPQHLHSLPLSGSVSELTVYNAVVNKLLETIEVVTLANE